MYKTQQDVLTSHITINIRTLQPVSSNSVIHVKTTRTGTSRAVVSGTMAQPTNTEPSDGNTLKTTMTADNNQAEVEVRSGGESVEKSGETASGNEGMENKTGYDGMKDTNGAGEPTETANGGGRGGFKAITVEESNGLIEFNEHGLYRYNFEKEAGTHGPVFWRQTHRGHWIRKGDTYYWTNRGHDEMLNLEAKQVLGKTIEEDEWGEIDMGRGEPLDNTWREVRGKEGIDEEGWWQEPGRRNSGNAFHREILTQTQVDRIRMRKQRGEKVYVDTDGNIEPNEFNTNEEDQDWNKMEEERERNNAEGEDMEEEDTEMDTDSDDEEVRMTEGRKGSDDGANSGDEDTEMDEEIDLEYPTIQEAMQIDQKVKELAAKKKQKKIVGQEKPQDNISQVQNGSSLRQKTIQQSATSWAGAASGVRFQTEEAPTYKYDTRFRVEISFDMYDIPKDNSTEEEQAQSLVNIMVAIMKRMKQVVKRFAIMPWKTGDRYKALEKTGDIPTNMMILRKYIRHEEEKEGRPYKRGFRHGRNAKWRLNLNFAQVTGKEFLHYWNESKKVYDQSKFITMKAAAMQAENYYGLGSFVNSSEKQFVDLLNSGLSSELGWAVETTFRDAPASYNVIDGFWKDAKKAAGNDAKMKYKLAPQALVVHCKASNPEVRSKLVKNLLQKYGGHDELGRYQQLPDGSRMRFVPAENRTPMIQRHKLKSLLATQIHLKSLAENIDFPYKIDRGQKFEKVEKTKGKTLGKLILELEASDPKYNNEPIFRHFSHSWSREYKDYGLAVSVLPAMVPLAIEALKTLPKIIYDMYGEEVASAIQPAEARWQSQVESLEPDIQNDGWEIDEYDRYGVQGGGNFVITGMTEITETGRDTSFSVSDNVSLLTPGTGLTERTFGENNNPKAAPIVIDDDEESGDHEGHLETHSGVRQGYMSEEGMAAYQSLLSADAEEQLRLERLPREKAEQLAQMTEEEIRRYELNLIKYNLMTQQLSPHAPKDYTPKDLEVLMMKMEEEKERRRKILRENQEEWDRKREEEERNKEKAAVAREGSTQLTTQELHEAQEALQHRQRVEMQERARAEFRAQKEARAHQAAQDKVAQEAELQRRKNAEAERRAQFKAGAIPNTPIREQNDKDIPGPFAQGFYLPGINSPIQQRQVVTPMSVRGRSGGRGRPNNNRNRLVVPLTAVQHTKNDVYMSDSEVGSITTVLEEEEGWNVVGSDAAREALARKVGKNTTTDESERVSHP